MSVTPSYEFRITLALATTVDGPVRCRSVIGVVSGDAVRPRHLRAAVERIVAEAE